MEGHTLMAPTTDTPDPAALADAIRYLGTVPETGFTVAFAGIDADGQARQWLLDAAPGDRLIYPVQTVTLGPALAHRVQPAVSEVVDAATGDPAPSTSTVALVSEGDLPPA